LFYGWMSYACISDDRRKTKRPDE